MTDFLASLTDEQRAAATTTSERALVEACAGSGKTRVIIARILHLLATGVDPTSIVAFTFTRSACEEIRSRLAERSGSEGVKVTTFHAYCAEQIVGPGRRVARESEQNAAIVTLADGSMRLPSRKQLPVKALMAALTAWEAGTRTLDQDEAHVLEFLRGRLRRAGASEGVDLVAMWDLIPEALRFSLPTGMQVLVDEAHDITPNEDDLVDVLATNGSRFYVLDRAQSIMGWRGAGVAFKGDVHRLTHSFRYGPELAELANVVLERLGLPATHGDPSRSTSIEPVFADEAWGNALLQALADEPHRVMVLCRTNRHAEDIERRCGGRAVHVKRDPQGDPFAAEADRFAEIFNRGKAVISTVHAAKGREADVVFVAPHSNFPKLTDPEDVRTFYVAVTRARRRLVLGHFAGCETWTFGAQPRAQEATPW